MTTTMVSDSTNMFRVSLTVTLFAFIANTELLGEEDWQDPFSTASYKSYDENPPAGWATELSAWPSQHEVHEPMHTLPPVYADHPNASHHNGAMWDLLFLPQGLLYKSYLAGEKEARFGTAWLYDSDRGWVWDVSLGGRVGIFRYGTENGISPEGWQLDIEGAGFPRLDPEEEDDVEAVDFRFGIPITWRRGPYAVKFGYYHVSAHVGDEFLERNPTFVRVNYVRDAVLLGGSVDVSPNVRVYAEVAWAFLADGGAEPWEFQFGAEYSPWCPRPGRFGAPFAAANVHLFEEFDFGGSINLMGGWQWRSKRTNRLLRAGLQYFNGKSSQYAFFNNHEELFGFGLWFDY